MGKRFDKNDFYQREFGEAALAIAMGQTKGFSHRRGAEAAGLDVMAEAAMNRSALAMFMKSSGGATLLSDSGLDLWLPPSIAFVQRALEQSLIGKVAAATEVGFNRGLYSASVTSSSSFTAEGEAKPTADTTFETFSLPPRKVTSLTTVSRDLLSDVAGAAELLTTLLQRDLTRTINATLVGSDAGDGASRQGSPTARKPSARRAARQRRISADLASMVDKLADAGASLDGVVWITSPRAAALLSLLKVADAGGMSMAGFPLATSATAAGKVILLSGSYLVFAVGPMTLSTSQEALIVAEPPERKICLRKQSRIAQRKNYINFAVSGPTDSNGAAQCAP